MPLSPKQLKLVFAKLRAKGLLKYIKKGRVGRASSSTLFMRVPPGSLKKKTQFRSISDNYVNPNAKWMVTSKDGVTLYERHTRGWAWRKEAWDMSEENLLRIISPEDVRRYFGKIPMQHVARSGWNGEIQFHDNLDGVVYNRGFRESIINPGKVMGTYNWKTGEMQLARFAGMANQGTPTVSEPSPRFMAIPDYDEHNRLGRASLQWRTPRIAAAHHFYHEFAHSLTGGPEAKVKLPDRWLKLVNKEWSSSVASARKTKGYIEYKEYNEGAAQEAFSDAYAMFLRSKTSRHRLKKQKPETYKYMKKFFEEK